MELIYLFLHTATIPKDYGQRWQSLVLFCGLPLGTRTDYTNFRRPIFYFYTNKRLDKKKIPKHDNIFAFQNMDEIPVILFQIIILTLSGKPRNIKPRANMENHYFLFNFLCTCGNLRRYNVRDPIRWKKRRCKCAFNREFCCDCISDNCKSRFLLSECSVDKLWKAQKIQHVAVELLLQFYTID